MPLKSCNKKSALNILFLFSDKEGKVHLKDLFSGSGIQN